MTRKELLNVAKPILFNTEMVKAILCGKKTETRRSCKLPKGDSFEFETDGSVMGIYNRYEGQVLDSMAYAPYHKGDILWVRETWQYAFQLDGNEQIIEGTGRYYYAAGPDDVLPNFTHWMDPDTGEYKDSMPWKPSIHMPKNAARIFLQVTDVRLERLQDIDDEHAKAEGANCKNGKNIGVQEKMNRTPVERFSEIWNSTLSKKEYVKFSWDANPVVWAIEFKILQEESK